MSKGRKTLAFSQSILNEALVACEAASTYNSRDSLYKAAVVKYAELGGENADRLTPILVYQRVKTWAIALKTPMGKRGRQPGEGFPAPQAGVERKSRFDPKAHAKLEKTILAETKDLPAGIVKVALKTLQSSKRSVMARIKLNCLMCSNYQREEIKHCQCQDTCVFHQLRPYQG